ncbi:SapC family protein [Pseudoalteromonas sp. CST5]|uniref:SapC family protein n=1 Tax=unclassified Pseudoalteromonas TaxID=194690 RepID=UPI00235899D7|nr:MULTISPECIES: SapC family protein [unclassified Pseudoalteromonas]MDC9513340.1 SapC family protein [Pseudoalteromonas sp. CST1]MDC9537423.1 SapC family protein [Pseudoalteromonas sp. CST3]MDC9541347.1 SapC family protein [Pseudoalteromonas sp. CST2]MDC9546072.1 SapC family protein [Pseudoalteromonas sp. CST4]MDC9549250.1 SapC family protein [Pseudoalteromonas sp. CST5]
MENLVALEQSAHQHIKIDTQKAQSHAENINMIPVVMAELNQIAVQQPIVFAKNSETGEFTLNALLGFEQHENLFYQYSQWQGVYLPLQLQRQPFFVGDTHAKQTQYPVCINLNSPAVINNQAQSQNVLEPIYTQNAEESGYLKKIKQCLGHLLQGEIDNKKLIDTLLQHELLQPLSLEVTFQNSQKTKLNGLYTINQERLAQLDSDQITLLHQRALLPAIYTVITSLGQIYPLIERKNAELNLADD